jgi:hypothetical protein
VGLLFFNSYPFLLLFDDSLPFGFLFQDVSHSSGVVEPQLSLHGSLANALDGVLGLSDAQLGLWQVLRYLNELDAVEDARIWRLVRHLKLGFILVELVTILWVYLTHGLQEHYP